MTDHTTDTSTIEDDIRTTRDDIDDKVRQIRDRLSPGDIVDGVIEFVRANGGSIAGGVGRSVRDNPVPAALIGAGVAWLALSSLSRRYDVEGYGEAARGRVQRRAEKARDSVSHRASNVAERAGAARRAAADRARRAGTASGRFVHDHPIVVGTAGVMLGAAIAASLPRWQREDRLYGAQSDSVKEKARHSAGEEGRKVQSAAKDAVEKARQAAEDRAAHTPRGAQSESEAAKPAAGSPTTSGKGAL